MGGDVASPIMLPSLPSMATALFQPPRHLAAPPQVHTEYNSLPEPQNKAASPLPASDCPGYAATQCCVPVPIVKPEIDIPVCQSHGLLLPGAIELQCGRQPVEQAAVKRTRIVHALIQSTVPFEERRTGSLLGTTVTGAGVCCI